jgi:ribose 5-phosphate isomerase B
MRIALGCDHAGYSLKTRIASEVEAAGHTVVDCGVDSDQQPVDYPDVARHVAHALLAGSSGSPARADRGIIICGSGVGVAVAASKFRGIRAGVCHDTYSARQGVEHDDMNILCLGARVVGPELGAELVRAFLKAAFSGEERHLRRLAKIAQIEREP